ncbi:MAG TPA: hypothetical protein VJG83_05395 [archaeon]|nr:hypothetical protein [archaeon]
MKKNKPKAPPFKLIDVGAGWWEGPAANFARQLQRKNLPGRVMAVEQMKKPEYTVPSNMSYIQGDALTYLERAPPQYNKISN